MGSRNSVLDEEKVREYIGITSKAIHKIKIAAPERSFNRRIADDFLKMAKAYHSDAEVFFKKGDLVNAFACVNYAHGWLDAGARIGIFDVGGDDSLFTLFE